MTLAVVLLAAGASTRLGECKGLVELGGSTPLARLAEASRSATPAAVVVVAGAHADRIAAWVAGHGAGTSSMALVVHPGWAAGRLGSVAAAASALPGHDLLVAPVDVPLVQGETFAALAAAWRAAGAPPRGWLAPEHGGRHGHPIVLGRGLAAETPRAAPDLPLRALRATAAPWLSVAVADEGVLDDLDTPADLARLRERCASRREGPREG